MKKFKALQSYTIMQLALLVFISAITAYSQESTNSNEQIKESDSFLHIGFINEAALYYHFSPFQLFTLKTGVGFNWDFNEKKGNEGFRLYKNPPHLNPNWHRENLKEGNSYNNYEAVFSSILFLNLSDNSVSNVLVGLGPAIKYSHRKNEYFENKFTDTSYSSYSSMRKDTELGAGISFSVIIKSRVYKDYYLIGEYNLSTLYTWNNTNNSYTSISKYSTTSDQYFSSSFSESKGNGWRIQFSNVKIGILIGL